MTLSARHLCFGSVTRCGTASATPSSVNRPPPSASRPAPAHKVSGRRNQKWHRRAQHGARTVEAPAALREPERGALVGAGLVAEVAEHLILSARPPQLTGPLHNLRSLHKQPEEMARRSRKKGSGAGRRERGGCWPVPRSPCRRRRSSSRGCIPPAGRGLRRPGCCTEPQLTGPCSAQTKALPSAAAHALTQHQQQLRHWR